MFYKISYTYIFLLLQDGIFVEFNPLWYIKTDLPTSISHNKVYLFF